MINLRRYCYKIKNAPVSQRDKGVNLCGTTLLAENSAAQKQDIDCQSGDFSPKKGSFACSKVMKPPVCRRFSPNIGSLGAKRGGTCPLLRTFPVFQPILPRKAQLVNEKNAIHAIDFRGQTGTITVKKGVYAQ